MDHQPAEPSLPTSNDASVAERPTLSAVVSGHVSAVVSAQEAALLLGVNERTIRRAIRRGELQAQKAGRSFAITQEALDLYRAQLRRPNRGDTSPLLHPLPDPVPPTPPTLLPTTERRHPAPLPAALTPFVGRSSEIAAVATLVCREDVRFVTLIGPGGVGKTRLALQVARQVSSSFTDGALFVSLASVSEASRVMPAIALALGQREDGERSALHRATSVLRDQHALLVLDNLEQVTAVGPELVELLSESPRLTLLVTSRTPLRVSGERIVDTLPLSLPTSMNQHKDNGDSSSLAQLAGSEAVRLFVERAEAAMGSFTLTESNARAVAGICDRTGGLPLAIELAAARVRVLSPAELLDRLSRPLPVLADGPQDQPARLRTMQSAIAWGYDLLATDQQALLRRLAVFTGGISLPAAEHIASQWEMSDRSPSRPTLDLLAALIDASLLQRREDGEGQSRFTMLETVREFALAQLETTGEEHTARTAHATYFTTFLDAAQPALWGATSEALLDQIEQEHDNLRAALAWTIEHDPAVALRLAGNLGQFWSKRSYWTEGRAWIERALATGAGDETIDRALALGRAGAIAGEQGDSDVARQYLTQSLELAQRLDDIQIEARALRGLGILASNLSHFDRARELFLSALERFQALDDKPGIARSLNDLGLVCERQGDQDGAIAYQEQALPIARAIGDEWHVCVILGNLGGAYQLRGDYARGQVLTLEALELARRIDDAFGVAVNLYNYGDSLFQLGDIPSAIASFREALELAQELGERSLALRAMESLGVSLHYTGDSSQAARLIGAASLQRDALGDVPFADEAVTMTAHIAAIKDHLGPAMYEGLWEAGRTLPWEMALTEALKRALAASASERVTSPSLDGLTPRETEVLRLLADGLSDREIADTIFVTRRTASKYVSTLLAKLGVSSRTAAAAFAHRNQLV